MLVTCGECLEKVEIQSENISSYRSKGGIEETFFNCPNCKEKYSVCITDREIRKMQRLIQKTNTDKRGPLQKKLRFMMDTLNGKI